MKLVWAHFGFGSPKWCLNRGDISILCPLDTARYDFSILNRRSFGSPHFVKLRLTSTWTFIQGPSWPNFSVPMYYFYYYFSRSVVSTEGLKGKVLSLLCSILKSLLSLGSNCGTGWDTSWGAGMCLFPNLTDNQQWQVNSEPTSTSPATSTWTRQSLTCMASLRCLSLIGYFRPVKISGKIAKHNC